MTLREYMELELSSLRRRLADVEAPGRQTAPTEQGRAYRAQLRADIAELEARLQSDEPDTLSPPSTTTRSPGCRRSPEDLSANEEKGQSALPLQERSS